VNVLLLLLLGAGAVAAASALVKLRKVKELPDLTDQEFLTAYRRRFDDPDYRVLAERKAIAECLTLPYQKLSPFQTFESLSKYTGFTTEYELGMSSLGDELAFVCEEAHVKTPEPFPQTVGEYLHEIISAKEKIPTR
jgi:hypothetical protein